MLCNESTSMQSIKSSFTISEENKINLSKNVNSQDPHIAIVTDLKIATLVLQKIRTNT